MISIEQCRECGLEDDEIRALFQVSNAAISGLQKIFKVNADNIISGAPENVDCRMRIGMWKGLEEARLILQNIDHEEKTKEKN